MKKELRVEAAVLDVCTDVQPTCFVDPNLWPWGLFRHRPYALDAY